MTLLVPSILSGVVSMMLCVDSMFRAACSLMVLLCMWTVSIGAECWTLMLCVSVLMRL